MGCVYLEAWSLCGRKGGPCVRGGLEYVQADVLGVYRRRCGVCVDGGVGCV